MKRLYFISTLVFVSIIVLMSGIGSVQAQPVAEINNTSTFTTSNFSVYLPAITSGNFNEDGNLKIEEDPFMSFFTSVVNGVEGQVVGAYAESVLAMPIVQQPSGNAGWISSAPNTITEFSAASSFGTTGLLAHNTFAGEKFFDLEIGQTVSIIYGDGSIQRYQIETIRSFQALEPTSPYSDFIDLETNDRLTATQLFYQVYTGDHHVTFQTCIYNEGDPSWGRLFVIATPIP